MPASAPASAKQALGSARCTRDEDPARSLAAGQLLNRVSSAFTLRRGFRAKPTGKPGTGRLDASQRGNGWNRLSRCPGPGWASLVSEASATRLAIGSMAGFARIFPLKLLDSATMPPPACRWRTDASQSSHCPSRHGRLVSPARCTRNLAGLFTSTAARQRVLAQLRDRDSSRSVRTYRADPRGIATRPVPSWFFGDGVTLMNQVNAQVRPSQTVTGIDRLLTESALSSGFQPASACASREHSRGASLWKARSRSRPVATHDDDVRHRRCRPGEFPHSGSRCRDSAGPRALSKRMRTTMTTPAGCSQRRRRASAPRGFARTFSLRHRWRRCPLDLRPPRRRPTRGDLQRPA